MVIIVGQYRAIQYLAKLLPIMSERTDKLRKLVEKWKKETEQQNDFETIKEMLTEKQNRH